MIRQLSPQEALVLQRKREIHSNNATVLSGILNSNKPLVITSSGLSIRFDPSNCYYSALKSLLSEMAEDHICYKFGIEVLLQGQDIPADIKLML